MSENDIEKKDAIYDPIRAAEEIGRLKFALRIISKLPVADQDSVAATMRHIAKEAINDVP